MNMKLLCRWQMVFLLLSSLLLHAQGVDLLKRYPTPLATGDIEHPRAWEFQASDLFRISRFNIEVGKDFHIEIGAADLGIGHCSDGAVWAVILPQTDGKLTSKATNLAETISHVWLRFHPGEISHLFPPETVSSSVASNLLAQVRTIANFKVTSSWQAGGNVIIPEPKDMTVDVDTTKGPRRFFAVDTKAQTVNYIAAFERRSVKIPSPFTPALAEAAFDQLWSAFDRDYAMFILRPEVDWNKSREQFRPLALNSKSSYEFAAVCARHAETRSATCIFG